MATNDNPTNPRTRRTTQRGAGAPPDKPGRQLGEDVTIAKRDILNLKRKVSQLEHDMHAKGGEVQRRGANLTVINQRITVLEKNLVDAITRLERDGGFGGDIEAHLREQVEIHTAAVNADLANLRTMIEEVYINLSQDIDAVNNRVDKVDLKLVNHDDRISANADAVASAHARIDRLTDFAPPWAWAVSIVAGIVAGIAWQMHEFGQSIQVGEASLSVTSVADETWVAVAIGVAAFLGVMGIVTSFTAFGNSQSSSSATSGASAAVNTGSAGVDDTQALPALPPPPQSSSTGSQPATSGSNPTPTQASGNVSASAGAGAAASQS